VWNENLKNGSGSTSNLNTIRQSPSIRTTSPTSPVPSPSHPRIPDLPFAVGYPPSAAHPESSKARPRTAFPPPSQHCGNTPSGCCRSSFAYAVSS